MPIQQGPDGPLIPSNDFPQWGRRAIEASRLARLGESHPAVNVRSGSPLRPGASGDRWGEDPDALSPSEANEIADRLFAEGPHVSLGRRE